MLILSFDVGIKNLSFCITKYNEEKNNIEIKEWGIINLLKDKIDKQKKCDKCTKFAKYKTKNNEYHFCQKHQKVLKLLKPFCLEKIDKKLDKCSMEKCKKKVKYTLNGKNICASHKVELQKEYNNTYKVLKIKLVNCKTLDMNEMLIKIIQVFDNKYLQFLLVDKVLIELQPVLKGPKMKTISNHIYSYFLINGVCNEKLKMDKVCYINASNKLKFFDENKEKDLKIYKNRKKIAIENTKIVLNKLNQEKFLKIFEESKKKDDLSDSLLQTLYYLEVNYNYKLYNKIDKNNE